MARKTKPESVLKTKPKIEKVSIPAGLLQSDGGMVAVMTKAFRLPYGLEGLAKIIVDPKSGAVLKLIYAGGDYGAGLEVTPKE